MNRARRLIIAGPCSTPSMSRLNDGTEMLPLRPLEREPSYWVFVLSRAPNRCYASQTKDPAINPVRATDSASPLAVTKSL